MLFLIESSEDGLVVTPFVDAAAYEQRMKTSTHLEFLDVMPQRVDNQKMHELAKDPSRKTAAFLIEGTILPVAGPAFASDFHEYISDLYSDNGDWSRIVAALGEQRVRQTFVEAKEAGEGTLVVWIGREDKCGVAFYKDDEDVLDLLDELRAVHALVLHDVRTRAELDWAYIPRIVR